MNDKIRSSIKYFLENENLTYHFDNALDVLFRTTVDGELIYMNKAGLKLFGYNITDDVEINVTDSYVNKQDRVNFINKLIKYKEVRKFQVDLRHNNKTLTIQMTAKITKSDDKIYIDGVMHDITESLKLQKKQEEIQKLDNAMEIIGGLSHELSQPIQVLLGGFTLFENEMKAKECSNNVKLFNTMRTQIDSLTTILSKLQRTNTYKTKKYLNSRIIDLEASSNNIV